MSEFKGRESFAKELLKVSQYFRKKKPQHSFVKQRITEFQNTYNDSSSEGEETFRKKTYQKGSTHLHPFSTFTKTEAGEMKSISGCHREGPQPET